MAYYLPSGGTSTPGNTEHRSVSTLDAESMADLRVFWGPEICRLEYLIHLLETGRIKDEYWQCSSETR